MRVLFAITKGETGGAQHHLRVLAEGLVRLGHTVGLVVTTPSELAETAKGIEVIPWPNVIRNPHPIRDARARRELASAVKRFRPDVLHLYSAKAGVLGRGLLRPPAGATIYTCHHSPYGPGRPLSHRLLSRPVEQLTLRYVDGVISDGSRDLPLIRKLAGQVPCRLIPNAVVPTGNPSSPTSIVPAALWVARMASPKDPLAAVRIWETVVEQFPGAELTMCGTGPLDDALQSRIERSAVRSQIKRLGKVPDIDPHFASNSLFLLVSDVEGGVTMATLEAMSHGLVPVVSDVGDAFLIEHAGAGVIAARGSVRAHAQAIISLLAAPTKVAAMRGRAIEFARERWTPDDFIAATTSFYNEILASG